MDSTGIVMCVEARKTTDFQCTKRDRNVHRADPRGLILTPSYSIIFEAPRYTLSAALTAHKYRGGMLASRLGHLPRIFCRIGMLHCVGNTGKRARFPAV